MHSDWVAPCLPDKRGQIGMVLPPAPQSQLFLQVPVPTVLDLFLSSSAGLSFCGLFHPRGC